MIINFTDDFRNDYYKLRDLLDEKYICSPEVQRSDAKAQKIVSSLYTDFVENYNLLPLEFRVKIDDEIRNYLKKSLMESAISEEDIDSMMSRKIKEIEKELEFRSTCCDSYKDTKVNKKRDCKSADIQQ